MDEQLSIKVTIADRSYPMKIKRSDEEKIRKAAKVINERIVKYQQNYSGKDQQDLLAMSSLQFVMQVMDLTEQLDKEPVLKQIQDINDQLSAYLRNA
jgi:cell division protein ZapA (FtsZ GTPase activity inhibitor)